LNTPVVVGLFPELLAVGGVQRAGRQIAAALQDFADERGFALRLLSLNDPATEHEFCMGSRRVRFHGAGRNKMRFLAFAYRSAGSACMVLAAHPNLAPAAWALRIGPRDVRYIVVAHGIEVWEPLPWLRRRALLGANLVFAPSSDTVEKVVRIQGVALERIRLLNWCLDPEFLAASTLEAPDCAQDFPTERVVLAVSRLAANERYKGIDSLIKAVPLLLRAVPDLRLAIVGDGDDQPRLRDLAVRLEISERVTFLGALERQELVACYHACEVFALPSAGEGFGLVFLEAMAHAKPVVGGAHGGTPDIIEDGVTGYLVESGNLPQLADRLQRLLLDKSLRCRLGEQGRMRVLRDFTFDSFSARFTTLLEGLLGS
jgi:phosphatidylinositol alpha-1,6-mannosyltransferase